MNTRDTLRLAAGTVLACLAVTSIPVAAQTVYKSVDDEGNVAFTDRPPLRQQAGDKPLDIMEVQIRLTDPTVIAANRDETLKQERAQATADGIRQQQGAEDAERAARKAEQQAANCDLARARLKRYSEARRLYREDDSGERSYLTSDEIDAERVSAARAVEDWCGN